jgi:hypothetical protein
MLPPFTARNKPRIQRSSISTRGPASRLALDPCAGARDRALETALQDQVLDEWP